MAAPEDESSAQSQSSSATAAPNPPPSSYSSSAGDHYLAKCVLCPSVVLQVAYGYFRSRYSCDIVFGKVRLCSFFMILLEYTSPESNLNLNCAYHMGEIAMAIKKGCNMYKLPADDVLRSYGLSKSIDATDDTILAGTLLGSIFVFAPISREEYELLEAVQAKLVVHGLLLCLGNDHKEVRGRENPSQATKILDGDMLAQFLELTNRGFIDTTSAIAKHIKSKFKTMFFSASIARACPLRSALGRPLLSPFSYASLQLKARQFHD